MKRFYFLLPLAFVLLLAHNAEAVEMNKAHRDKGVKCVDCHGEASPQKEANAASCANCHKGTPGSVKKYSDQGNMRTVNVHDSHEGSLRCTLCHHIHKDSTFYCNDCHKFEAKVP